MMGSEWIMGCGEVCLSEEMRNGHKWAERDKWCTVDDGLCIGFKTSVIYTPSFSDTQPPDKTTVHADFRSTFSIRRSCAAYPMPHPNCLSNIYRNVPAYYHYRIFCKNPLRTPLNVADKPERYESLNTWNAKEEPTKGRLECEQHQPGVERYW